ncbi:M24 family metallopeptidase [Acetanaerobacterium elongatum]|uniref:Xaa-Pro dipeptidase n=1 Tax=Acetanaerobacterium elongatum TaxID=258515 RepID=A0A1H0BYJ3_9FIRM|nr:aminopeptidase P family protein [Acetanaerobacterium elongatum]SDN50652.1 Xaa-Pro dipeptidase [Acetanaerobacterium elongatum]
MNNVRLDQTIKGLAEIGLAQMVITDPATIYYLTGRWIDPGERLLALYMNSNGQNRMLINELFTVPEELGVQKVWYSDTQNAVALLAECIERDKPLGIDKNMPARFLLGLMELEAASGYKNASVCVDRVRARKDKNEAELMRRASRMNDVAIGMVAAKVREGITEEQLAAEVIAAYRCLGAEGVSFEPLIGFGANAAIGHHAPDQTVLREGDCVLIDIGCKKDGYCADMTRTYFYRSVPEKLREVYGLVQQANAAARAIIKPGVRFCDIDAAARNIIAEAGYGSFFTHRLGHSIGIEVHEYGDVSSVNENPVEEGMVFSIEPGIYLPDIGGVRIEDLVLVTANGCETLNCISRDLNIL